MKKKINIQFIVIALIAILTTVSLSAFVFYNLFEREVIRDLKMYTQLMVETDAWEIVTNPDSSKGIQINKDISELRVTLISADGTAIFDSNAEAGLMENHSQRPEIIDAIEKGEGESIRKSATVSKNLFYYAVKLDNGYVLRVAKEARSIASVFIRVFPIIELICIVLFLICIWLSHLLTKSILKPIENLANNLDASDSVAVYSELTPFVETIKNQHIAIVKNANMRQEFTANVSHELKTPLTSISGYSELIESGMATNEDVVRFAAEIHKSSNRLLTLINDIIRLSQLDEVVTNDEFEQINIYDIAQSSIEILEMSAQKHNVTLNLEGEKQFVYANKQMMEELIYNLCDNAIRYNNPGGKVNVSVLRKNDNVVIEVKDTGIGISKENQERIFERFYRVDKSRSKSTGGTGLGLAIVKHIVARHENARIELESDEGAGTTIRVIFDMNMNKN